MGNTSILWEIHRSYGKYIDPMGNGLKKICPLCYISNKKRSEVGEVGGPCKSAKNGNDMKWSSFQSEGDSFQVFFCLCLFLFFALGEVGLDFPLLWG